MRRNKKMIWFWNGKKIVSMILCACLIMCLTTTAHASVNDVVQKSKNSLDIVENYFEIHKDFILEKTVILVDGQYVTMERTTYSDNRTVVKILDASSVEEFCIPGDYSQLKENLNNSGNMRAAASSGRVSGYNYTYMRTISQTSYIDQNYSTYATLLAILNRVLAKYHLPSANIAKIASALYAFNATLVDMKFVDFRAWYEVTEKASGAFIGYYCEWNAYTYVKNSSGSWILLDSERGYFDSTNVY